VRTIMRAGLSCIQCAEDMMRSDGDLERIAVSVSAANGSFRLLAARFAGAASRSARPRLHFR
jgi:hypothetical protein